MSDYLEQFRVNAEEIIIGKSVDQATREERNRQIQEQIDAINDKRRLRLEHKTSLHLGTIGLVKDMAIETARVLKDINAMKHWPPLDWETTYTYRRSFLRKVRVPQSVTRHPTHWLMEESFSTSIRQEYFKDQPYDVTTTYITTPALDEDGIIYFLRRSSITKEFLGRTTQSNQPSLEIARDEQLVPLKSIDEEKAVEEQDSTHLWHKLLTDLIRKA